MKNNVEKVIKETELDLIEAEKAIKETDELLQRTERLLERVNNQESRQIIRLESYRKNR